MDGRDKLSRHQTQEDLMRKVVFSQAVAELEVLAEGLREGKRYALSKLVSISVLRPDCDRGSVLP